MQILFPCLSGGLRSLCGLASTRGTGSATGTMLISSPGSGFPAASWAWISGTRRKSATCRGIPFTSTLLSELISVTTPFPQGVVHLDTGGFHKHFIANLIPVVYVFNGDRRFL